MRPPPSRAAVLGLLVLLVVSCGDGTVDAPPPGESAGAGSGWVRLPDAPLSPRSRSVVEAVGSLVVVVGGWELRCPPTADCAFPEEPLLGDGAVFDTGSGRWSSMAAAPFGLVVGERQTVASGGSVFTVTGCRSGMGCAGTPELLEYDVAADRWVEHGRLPGMRTPYVALVAVGDRLVVHRGSDEQGRPPDLLFDPASATWQTLPVDPLPEVYDRFAVAVGDDLVLAGSPMAGVEEGGEQDTKLLARLDVASGAWTQLPDSPGPGYQLWPAGDGLLLNGHYRDSWLLDPANGRWTVLPPLDGAGAVDLRGVVDAAASIYDVPGIGAVARDGRGRLYDVRSGDYVVLTAPPGRDEAYDDVSTAVGSSLFVFGGQEWSDSEQGRLLRDAWLWTPPD